MTLRFLILCCSLWIGMAYATVPLISLDFSSIATRNLIQLLAQFAHKNVIISDHVKGNISIKLDQVSWNEALTLILQMQGLSKHETKRVIFITPTADATFTTNAIIKLNHADAAELAELLNKQPDFAGKISADARTNSLLIHDAAEKIALLKNAIANLDIPSQQVLIKATIVNVDDNFMRELGVKFGGKNTTPPPSDISMDLPLTSTDPGHFEFAIAKLGDGAFLNMELAALENEGHAKIISTPKLLTTNSKPAYIEAGAEIPYQEKTSSGATNVAFKKAVLSLKVTPEIIARRINLAIELNQDKVSQMIVSGVPAIDTRAIKTQVLLNHGETLVLGGIYEYSNNSDIVRVPFLGAIPGIGLLFSNKQTKLERRELLIFVTPEIVN